MKTINDFPIILVNDLPPIAIRKDRIAMDIEVFGMKKGKLHRPIGEFAFLGATFDGKTVYYITEQKDIQQFLDRVNNGVWIFQKGDFDYRQLRRWADIQNRDRYWDTMYIEKILFSGYYDSFSLQSLTRRWLQTYISKDVRNEFETNLEMTPEMIKYAGYDVILTWHVYKKQRQYIDEKDLNVWKNIDIKAIWSVLKTKGMLLDVEAWKKLAEKNQQIANEIQAKYPEINLASSKQVGKELEEQGYNLPTTDKGNLKVDKKTLKKLKESSFVNDKIAFSESVKLANTYGLNIINEFVEPDGRIWANFNVNGASTGRYSSDSPNLENIPKRSGKEFRECFISSPNHSYIVADYSSQEPRIGTYFSQDELLIDIFKSKKDVYIESAKLMFNWEITKKDPRRNERIKPTVLGAFYGLSKYGLLREYGIPLEEGEELLEAFFNTFSGVRDWIKKQQKQKKYVETLYGRKFWLNPYLSYGKSERNTINSPIQGTAADMMKLAEYEILEWYGWKEIVVNRIHDEIVLEIPNEDVEKVKNKVKEIMIQTAEKAHPGVPADVEIYINTKWSPKD